MQEYDLPCADSWNLFSLSFDDFSLDDHEMLLASVTMFLELGLVNKFNIDKKVSDFKTKYQFNVHNSLLEYENTYYKTERFGTFFE